MTERAVSAADTDTENRLPYDVAFWLLLLAFEIVVLSLPLFPTGDSGMHIYYATIFRDLLRHESPLYAQVYAVRHVIQPYCLHYYIFIALRSFLTADTAEKLIVAAILPVVALGFRSLVRALSPRSPALPLLIFPFLLSWPLAMGGLNYSFALGLLFFALSVYESLWLPGPTAPRLWRFAGLLLLLILAHPVPLLLLLCILGLDLMLRRWMGRRDDATSASFFPGVLALSSTCVAFLIPALLADKGQVGKSVSDVHLHLRYFRQIFNASRLGMFFRNGLLGRVYNKAFFLLLPLSLGVVVASGFVARLRTRSLRNFDRLAIFSVLFLLASLFAPFELNGSAYFSFRLWLPCWLLGLAACSGALKGQRWNRATAAYAILLSCVTFVLAIQILRPIAQLSKQLEQAPLPPEKRGLFVQGESGEIGAILGVGYPVYWWSGGRAFIAHEDVMLNSAWLNLTIIPLKERGKAGLLRDETDLVATENPNQLGSYLADHPAEREVALEQADFILFSEPGPDSSKLPELIRLTLGPVLRSWHCDLTPHYAVCLKGPAAKAS